MVEGEPMGSNIGTMLRRSTYHYWFHNGEANAIRQLLGHANVPEFVGDIAKEAPYRSEWPALDSPSSMGSGHALGPVG